MASSNATDYETMKGTLLNKGDLFVDTDFPANDKSIGKIIDRKIISRTVWKRPEEILSYDPQTDGMSPVFIRNKATRADLDQGQLHNCWFVAAAACLAVGNRHLFHNVIQPEGQTFEIGQYAGIFWFQFWRYGHWEYVVIDDRLPTVDGKLVFAHNMEEPNEFWAPLMEKAYAKFIGSYSDLENGVISEALVDFTGGISKMYQLDGAGKNFFSLMHKTVRSNCMMGSLISATQREKNGLVKDHAYSITAVDEAISIDGQLHKLLRLRNPAGKNEWEGDWFDCSTLWRTLDHDTKERLNYKKLDDGEFWMSYSDWLKNFEFLEICYLSPEELTDPLALDTDKTTWHVNRYEGQWKSGVNAGGCNNDEESLYWTNPQCPIHLTNTVPNDGGRCSIVVSLLVVNFSSRPAGTSVAFDIYKIKEGRAVAHGSQVKGNLSMVANSGRYSPQKEVTEHFNVKPGYYIIIPSTYERHEEAKFLLRVFSEQSSNYSNLILEKADEKSGNTNS